MNKFKLTKMAFLFLPLMMSGCQQESSSNITSNVSAVEDHISFYAQDTIRQTDLMTSYYVDLRDNVSASDDSIPEIISVSPLSPSHSCKVLAMDEFGFRVDVKNSQSCIYEYKVGPRNSSKSVLDKVQLGVATALVLSSESTELLKPISATATVGESIDIFVANELARYGYVVGVGFDLDESSLVIPNTSISGSHASVNVSDSSIHYTPGHGFTGVERIIYSYTNGHEVLTGSIDIAVSDSANTAPTAQYFYFQYNDSNEPVPNGQDIEIDVKDFIADADGDTLQLIDVFAYDANLSIPLDSDSNGNNFDDTTFIFNSAVVGRHSIVYVVSDNRGGFATGVIDLMVSDVYHNINVSSVTPALQFRPPFTSTRAQAAGLKYAKGPKGDGTQSLLGVSTAMHDWITANSICEAQGGSLPSTSQMLSLYSDYPLANLFASTNWPIDIEYWTSTSGLSAGEYQSVNMNNGSVDTSVKASSFRYVTCLVDEETSVNVIGAKILDVGPSSDSVVELYELEGTYSNGLSEIIDTPLVTWSAVVNPPELADFNTEYAELTTHPQLVEINGMATITGCISSGLCDAISVELLAFARSPTYGTWASGPEVYEEFTLSESNTIRGRCGSIVDAIGTPESGTFGNNGGTLWDMSNAHQIKSIDIDAGVFAHDGSTNPMVTKLIFRRQDGSSQQCGSSGSTTSINTYNFTVPDGHQFFGFRAFKIGTNGYIKAIQFITIPSK